MILISFVGLSMRKSIQLFLGAVLLFGFVSTHKVYAETSDMIVDARIVEVGELIEHDGLRSQTVKAQILSGDYKGSIQDVQVLFDSGFFSDLGIGDHIKVSILQLGDEVLFQFYDFSRTRSYFILILLFFIITIVFFGLRGLKILIPSIAILFFIICSIIPNQLIRIGLIGNLILTGSIALFTARSRLKNTIFSIIVMFSVVVCLLIGYLIFVGFSQSAYVVPFVGSVSFLSSNKYDEILQLMNLSILIIPAGAVINASIQVTKHLSDQFSYVSRNSLGNMFKEGIRVGQKITAGELNNLIILIAGLNLLGMYQVHLEHSSISIWDNGWVALQVIYLASSGLAILCTAFITVAMWAMTFKVIQGRDRLGDQTRLKSLA
jgi:uncharacterized membrane protein